MLCHYQKIFDDLTKLNENLSELCRLLKDEEKKYLQNVADAKRRLQEKLAENADNIKKVNAFISIGKTHSKNHVKSNVPLTFNSRELTGIAVQINSSLDNDTFAAQLYTKGNWSASILGTGSGESARANDF